MTSERGPRRVTVRDSTGRVPVPLLGLPSGVEAFSVPKPESTVSGGDTADRVPKDRRKRLNITRADLFSTEARENFEVPDGIARRDLVWALRTQTARQWAGMTTRFGDQAWDTAISLVRAGVGSLRCVVDGLSYRPHTFRLTEAWAAIADDRITDLTGYGDPDTRRAALITRMRPIRQLDDERALLAGTEKGAALRVPSGSRTKTRAWSVYEAAIRAASVWFPDTEAGVRHTAKSLAGDALTGTKRWTPERQTAFANLIRTPFAAAVDEPDVEVLVRGPLVWRVGDVAADAQACEPWIGLPASGIRMLGKVDVSRVRGVLFVENKDTFEYVCRNTDLNEDSLCVWGKGYSSDSLIALLSTMGHVPMAAWCDLDADGINIVVDLASRLGVDVHPVGMGVDLWAAGPFRAQKDSELERGRDKARSLVPRCPAGLRDLAAAIAETGQGREQETLQREVTPTLRAALERLWSGPEAGGLRVAEDD